MQFEYILIWGSKSMKMYSCENMAENIMLL